MRENLLNFVNDYSTTITLAVGLITIIGIIWRKAIVPGMRMVTDIRNAFVGLRQLIEAQLAENGGGSMVDKVNLIQPNHLVAEEHWKSLEAVADKSISIAEEMLERFDNIESRLKAMETKPSIVVNTGDKP